MKNNKKITLKTLVFMITVAMILAAISLSILTINSKYIKNEYRPDTLGKMKDVLENMVSEKRSAANKNINNQNTNINNTNLINKNDIENINVAGETLNTNVADETLNTNVAGEMENTNIVEKLPEETMPLIPLTPTIPIIDKNWDAKNGVNFPKLTTGMKAIYWESDGTEKKEGIDADFDTDKWYDYAEQTRTTEAVGKGTSKWANAKTQDGSYWVWIPRYAYKITSTGEIDVVFVDTKNRNGKTVYNLSYVPNNYVVHPAFIWETKNLSGIWVAKYEASRTDATETFDGVNTNFKSVPNVKSFRNTTADEIFNNCKNMKNTDNLYGFTEKEKPHMMKNTEWGAVAYLSQSKYGRNKTEVAVNSNSSYITGKGSIEGQEVLASSTGNKYGIYDLSGGTFEYVASYLEGGTVVYYESIQNEKNENYKEIYDVINNKNKYGDAIFETKNWNKDYYNFVNKGYPIFLRGGSYVDNSGAGLFAYSSDDGIAYDMYGFRPVCFII